MLKHDNQLQNRRFSDVCLLDDSKKAIFSSILTSDWLVYKKNLTNINKTL